MEDDANIARREGVQRKTFQYLQRAEQLLSRLTRQGAPTTGPVALPYDKVTALAPPPSTLSCALTSTLSSSLTSTLFRI